MAGEISHADALGAEALAITNSYRGAVAHTANLRTKYKDEPIHAVGDSRDKSKGKCYHCGSKDHFIAQCPRWAGGLAPAAAAVQEQDNEDPADTIEVDGVHYVRNRFVPGRNQSHWKRPAVIGRSSTTAGTSGTDRRPINRFSRGGQIQPEDCLRL